ncbi:MAG TPA: ABC transporter permease [Gemmatimonadaceae bacterium]|nr:ABC transporter permease [Gemmatimonadaceae bacterium]
MHTLLARARSFYRALVRPQQLGADMEDEMRFHIDMQAQRLVREHGLDEREARRRAALAFGGVQRHKELGRRIRGVQWVAGATLDVRLGLRMLAKHRGLALVGGFGMAIAIAIAAVAFGVISAFVDPTLPFPQGDRVVSIQNWDSRLSQANRRALYDFGLWRAQLRSVRELGAARMLVENLVDEAGRSEPVALAEMTASGFRVTRTPPLLGRSLLDADEAEGASPVAVIGYDLWQSRFNGDSRVVGSRVRIGGELHTVVGVMPQGFAFPVRQALWTPLRIGTVLPDSGPEIHVFGRLADGATLQRAQTELDALSASLARAEPQTHAMLRARVLPYTYPFLDLNDPAMVRWLRVVQGFVMVILVYVCANVAIVVYARTAAREAEFVVRTALGASRGRIVAQLLFEGLVLSGAASVVGLALAAGALRRANALELGTGGLPFWMRFGLSVDTVVYVTWLAVLAAVVIGVLPALRVTGRDVQSRIRAIGGGAAGLRLGRSWTALVVAQLAITVTLLPIAMYSYRAACGHAFAEPGFAADRYVATALYLDDATRRGAFGPADARRYAALQRTLLERLRDESWVAGAVVTGTVPGAAQRARVLVERDRPLGGTRRADTADVGGEVVGVSLVGADFFDAFGVARLAGRAFRDDDLTASARAVIVNRSFVRDVLGGGSAIGRRVRRLAAVPGDTTPEVWYEIVGVVDDLRYPDSDVPPAAVYFPLDRAATYPVSLVVRTRGPAPAAAATRMRALAAGVDPTLRLGDITTLEDARRQEQLVWRVVSSGIGFLTLSVLLLSAAGIYALMSFTVTRQRREIGIRTALGAQRKQLLWTVFSRAGTQVLGGLGVGVALALLIDVGLTGGALLRGQGLVLVPAAGLVMAIVGLTAAFGPARRALRVEPTQALREQ